MSFNFPSNPNPGDEFTPPGGPTYVWNPPRWNMKPGGGGGGTIILSGPKAPENDVGSPGNWYVNTSTGEWWGPKGATAWPTPPTPLYRSVLQANRTYFVDPALGNDNNSGLAPGSGAFATIARAVAVIYSSIDTGNVDCAIQLAAGTITEQVTIFGRHVGARPLIIQGTGVGNTIWTSAGRTCYATRGALVTVANIELRSTGGAALLAEDSGTNILIGAGMRFGAAPSNNPHIWAFGGGKVVCRQPYSITGGASQHWRADVGGQLDIAGITVTITAAVTFSHFAFAGAQCLAAVNGNTFTGAANVTGTRFLVNPGGQIDTNGGGANYLPGTVAGVTQANGIYS